MLVLPVSGKNFPGLFTVSSTGSDLVTGGAFGPEAGIIGIASRLLIIALLLGYLILRYRGGSVATLSFAPEPQKRTATERAGSRYA